jgi:hypothetical protein
MIKDRKYGKKLPLQFCLGSIFGGVLVGCFLALSAPGSTEQTSESRLLKGLRQGTVAFVYQTDPPVLDGQGKTISSKSCLNIIYRNQADLTAEEVGHGIRPYYRCTGAGISDSIFGSD